MTETQISPALQQAMVKLNLRYSDLMEQFNSVVKIMYDENQALRAKLLELQAPVKPKQPETQ